MVRPLLEFSSIIWSCINNNVLLMENLQCHASKFILNDFSSEYKSRLTTLDLLPLFLRRDYLDVIFLYNNIMDLSDSNLHKYLIFRNDSCYTYDELMLVKRLPKYDFYHHFYVFRIIKSWNSIPYDIRSPELSGSGYYTPFKREIQTYLQSVFNNNFDNNNSCTWVYLVPVKGADTIKFGCIS